MQFCIKYTSDVITKLLKMANFRGFVITSPDPEVINLFQLNSAEREILKAHKCLSKKKFSFFLTLISPEF